MDSRRVLRRASAAVAVALVAACQDGAPTGTPSDPSLARSAQAQDRLEAVFQRISPEVMAIPGTVFSDNDEVAGKLVIGVENVGAAGAVRNAMARLGVAESDYA